MYGAAEPMTATTYWLDIQYRSGSKKEGHPLADPEPADRMIISLGTDPGNVTYKAWVIGLLQGDLSEKFICKSTEWVADIVETFLGFLYLATCRPHPFPGIDDPERLHMSVSESIMAHQESMM
jgi:hypothetical protein